MPAIDELRAEMAAFDALPPDVRRATASAILPPAAAHLHGLLLRTPAPVVVAVLEKSNRKVLEAQARRLRTGAPPPQRGEL